MRLPRMCCFVLIDKDPRTLVLCPSQTCGGNLSEPTDPHAFLGDLPLLHRARDHPGLVAIAHPSPNTCGSRMKTVKTATCGACDVEELPTCSHFHGDVHVVCKLYSSPRHPLVWGEITARADLSVSPSDRNRFTAWRRQPVQGSLRFREGITGRCRVPFRSWQDAPRLAQTRRSCRTSRGVQVFRCSCRQSPVIGMAGMAVFVDACVGPL